MDVYILHRDDDQSHKQAWFDSIIGAYATLGGAQQAATADAADFQDYHDDVRNRTHHLTLRPWKAATEYDVSVWTTQLAERDPAADDNVLYSIRPFTVEGG